MLFIWKMWIINSLTSSKFTSFVSSVITYADKTQLTQIELPEQPVTDQPVRPMNI